jgi:FAD/FMN-containing dehydrogenase
MGVLLDFWNQDLCGPSSSMGGEVEIIALGGAMARVPEDAPAFANRGSLWWLNFAILWDDEADDASNIARIRAAHQRLRPWLGRGVYVNMLNLDELDQVVDAYGGVDAYRRLGAVKARYDPNDLFRLNHNIRPVPAAATF